MKVAILEEDDLLFEQIKTRINAIYDGWNVIRYRSSFALVTGIADELKGDINLMLLHILPNNYEYIHMAKDIQSYFSHIKVIFYSETNDCAEQIFVADPIYFLLLPMKDYLLVDALKRVENDNLMEQGQTITIKYKGEIQKIKFATITYIESIGRKIRFYTSHGSFESYHTMDEIRDILPVQFQQCHRSFLVNMDKIMRVTAEGILLCDMELVPLSRTYYEKIKEIFQSK